MARSRSRQAVSKNELQVVEAREAKRIAEESSRNLNNGTVRFSVATYKDWTDSNGQRHKGTREQVIDSMTKSKFSKKDISAMIRKMYLAYDYMRKLETLTDADGNVRFDEFEKWAPWTTNEERRIAAENRVKQASDAVNFSANDAKGKGKKKYCRRRKHGPI